MATLAARPKRATRRGTGSGLGGLGLLTRRAVRDARARTLGFAYLFAAIAYLQPVAYRHTYATLAERLAFARSFGNNQAVVLFYGKAYDLLTVGGYTAWRVGGTLTIMAGAFGMLAAVRALRTEEESGRAELVLAGRATRTTYLAASLLGIAAQTLVLWAAITAGAVLGGLDLGGSAYLALAIVSCIPVLAGAGALASQLAPSRRLALELGCAVVGVCFLARVVADTASGAGWLRWLTPMGWSELARPFTGERPAVLLAPALTAVGLFAAALAIAAGRDVGRGLLASRETRAPRLGLLQSPTAQALREERTSLVVWLSSIGAFALIYGVISKSISSASIPASLQHALSRLGAGSTLSPRAYIAFAFSLLALVLCLLAVSQVAGARREELEGRLTALVGLPVRERAWLLGRLAIGAAALVAAGLLAALAAWAGAVSQGVSLPFWRMLEAGLNCLPVALLFLGLTAVAYALVPRASAGIGYGLVTVAYLWEEVGALLGVPHWLVDATPFAHVALVPAASMRVGPALAMAAIGLLAVGLAAVALERRDVVDP